MQKIRPDAMTAQFYNDGLVIFIYDDQNQAVIKAINPSILEGYGESDINSELFEVAEKGLLVVYELQQDDGMAVELSVGEPLSDEEKNAFAPCVLVQRAYINLPSGKIAIEGYGNLRLSPEIYPNEEPGALFDVPAGDYILSIYSIDVIPETDDEDEDIASEPKISIFMINMSADVNDEVADDMAPMPNHLFVLTPLDHAEPLPERKPLLYYRSCDGPPDEHIQDAYTHRP